MSGLSKRAKDLLFEFGMQYNLIPVRGNRSPTFLMSLLLVIQTFQLLSLVLPYNYAITVNALIPLKLMIWISSPRTWIVEANIKIALLLGIFLLLSTILTIITIHAIVQITKHKKVPLTFKSIVENKIPLIYSNVLLIPSVEIAFLVLFGQTTYTRSTCTTAGCQHTLRVFGAFLILTTLGLCLLFEVLTVHCSYQSQILVHRISMPKSLLSRGVALILGLVSAESEDMQTSMICSLVWAGLSAFGIMMLIYQPEFNHNVLNRLSLVTRVITMGMVATNVLEYHGLGKYTVIVPLVASAGAKFALNIQEYMLWRSWRLLKPDETSPKHLDVSLQVLYNTLNGHDKFDYKFLEMLNPIFLSLKLPQISSATLTLGKTETDTPETEEETQVFEEAGATDPDVFFYVQKVKKSLIAMVRSTYHTHFVAKKGRIPAESLCSYVEFLTEVCQDYTQSIFASSYGRHFSEDQLSFREQIRMKVLFYRIKQKLKRQNQRLDQEIEELCIYLEKFDSCTKRVDQFVGNKVAFHAKFLEPCINLKSIKEMSHSLLKTSTALATELESLIYSQRKHRSVQLLYEFLVKQVQEDVNRFRRMKPFLTLHHYWQEEEEERTKEMEISDETLLNSDSNSKVTYIIISLDPHNCGKLVSWAPNFPSVIATSSEYLISTNIRDIIAPFQVNYFNALCKEIQKSSNLTEIYQRRINVFLKTKNQELLHYDSQFEVQLFKGEPTLAIYLKNNLDFEQKFLLFQETGQIIGSSKSFRETLLYQFGEANLIEEIQSQKLNMRKLFPALTFAALQTDGARGKTSMKIPQVQTKSQQNLKLAYHNLMVEYSIQNLDDTATSFRIGMFHIWKIKNPQETMSNLDKSDSIDSMDLLEKSGVHLINPLTTGRQSARSFFPSVIRGPEMFEPSRFGSSIENLRDGDETLTPTLDFPSVTKRSGILTVAMTKRVLLKGKDNIQKPPEHSHVHEFNKQDTVSDVNTEKVKQDLKKMDAKKRKRIFMDDGASIYASESSSTIAAKRAASKILLLVYRLKELVNQGQTPSFLKQTNYFGMFSLGVLALMVVCFYAVLNNKYYYYSQYANTAYFPSYFASVVKSLYAVTEVAVSVNTGYVYDPTNLQKFSTNPGNVYRNRVQRFVQKYNQYMVQYDIRQVLPNIDSGRYSLLLQRSTFDSTPSNYSFQDTTTVLLGLTYNLNKTKFSLIDNSNADVLFLRSYAWDYIDLYEKMRFDLFDNFDNQLDSIQWTLRIMIITVVIFCVIMSGIFILILGKLHRHEIRILSKLCTIPDAQTISSLEKLQVKYKAYFQRDLVIPSIEKTQTKKKAKEAAKQTRTRNVKQFVNQSHNSFVYLANFSVIPILFGTFVILTGILAAKKTNQTISFKEDLKVMSGIVVYVATSTASNLIQMNLMEPANFTARYNQYTAARNDIVDLLQDVQTRIFDNPMSTPKLIERYRNLTNSNFCYDSFGTPNYQNCMTSLKGASALGFASLYDRQYMGLMTMRDSFLQNSTVENAITLIDSTDFVQIDSNGPCIDATIVANIETEGAFLYNFCKEIQQSIIWILISGLLLLLILAILVWLPMYIQMKQQFMQVRQIFSQLPVELIMHNNYIKIILKAGGESSI